MVFYMKFHGVSARLSFGLRIAILTGAGTAGLLLAGPLQAAGEPVGVVPFRAAEAGRGEEIAARVLTELQKTGRYVLVERGQLKQALAEIARNQSGSVDAAQALEIGRLSGARYLIVGELNPAGGSSGGAAANSGSGGSAIFSATARVIKTETGVVVGAATAVGTPGEIAGRLARQLDDCLSIYFSLQNPASPYSILLQLDRGKAAAYRLGERIRLKFKVLRHRRTAPRRVYIRLYAIDARGAMRLIYPNKFSEDRGIDTDQEYDFPAKTDGFEWALVKPAGVESIQAVVTTSPIDFYQTKGSYRSRLFPQVYAGDARKREAYRAIEVRIDRDKIKDWSAERVSYTLSE